MQITSIFQVVRVFSTRPYLAEHYQAGLRLGIPLIDVT